MEEESQPNDSLSGHQDRKTELDETLEGVLLPEMCELREQYIYKVPPRIRKAHPQAYTPQIISIGPFHNPLGRGPCGPDADEHTNILWSENLKLKYLKGFLNRTKLSAGDFFSELKKLENRIRSCYVGPFIYNNNDFLKIIITDACFMIELFLRNYAYENWKEIDPILSKPCLFGHIRADLILLENQLPFFVLEEIYEFAALNDKPSFVSITTCYFKEFNKHDINIEGKSPKHFIDLLRMFLIPPSFDHEQNLEQENNTIPCCQINFCSSNKKEDEENNSIPCCQMNFCSSKKKEAEEEEEEENNPIPCCQINFFYPKKKEQENNPIDHVYSASQLSEAGLKFKVSEDSESLLDLKFDDKKGVLKMPRFYVNDSTEIHLRNILAFEECHFPYSGGYIGQYLKILDFLINTEKDVSILVDNKIIVNWMGDASSMATMINNLNNNVSMPCFDQIFKSLFHSLNGFYENPRNKYKAIFIREYFNTPWKKVSTITAVLLLLLTLTQTICSVWSLLEGKDQKIGK